MEFNKAIIAHFKKRCKMAGTSELFIGITHTEYFRVNFNSSNDYMEIATIKDRKLHGPYTTWINEVLKQQCYYYNGKRHGVSREYHPNGNLAHESNYNHGELHGLSIGWYSNNDPRYICIYHNDKIHGVSKEWSPSRKLKVYYNPVIRT